MASIGSDQEYPFHLKMKNVHQGPLECPFCLQTDRQTSQFVNIYSCLYVSLLSRK